jgi:ribosomal protein S18 acetylase RimI-like enzyme
MIIYKEIYKDNYDDVIKELVKIEKKIFKDKSFVKDDFDTIKHDSSYNLVVADNGKIVGYLMTQLLKYSSEHRKMKNRNKIMYIESIGLLQSYQHQGIGKQLIKYLINYCIRNNIKYIILDTCEYSMKCLSKSLGFKKLYYNSRYYYDSDNKQSIGAICMRLKI